VSLELSNVCIVDAGGKIMRETKVASDLLNRPALTIKRWIDNIFLFAFGIRGVRSDENFFCCSNEPSLIANLALTDRRRVTSPRCTG
jgi:hypothetical protein